MTRVEVLEFMQAHRYAVQASASAMGTPQAAVVGFAVSDSLEIVFDTLDSSRKAQNLKVNKRVSLVIGGLIPGDERTVQLDGIADQPQGSELERLKTVYYKSFPDGSRRLAWPGLTYFPGASHMAPLQRLQQGSPCDSRAQRAGVSDAAIGRNPLIIRLHSARACLAEPLSFPSVPAKRAPDLPALAVPAVAVTSKK